MAVQKQMFEDDWGVDNSPPDDTEIVQIILYLNRPDTKEFKRLCKEGIKDFFPDNFQEKGNVSDFLLQLLRKYYGATESTSAEPSAVGAGAVS